MITKNEYRQFETEIEFIIKENDLSAFKNVLSFSPIKQIEERRKKFDYMISKLFDQYGLDNQELFDNFDAIWKETAISVLENKTLLRKVIDVTPGVGVITNLSFFVEWLRAYYCSVKKYCLDYAKKQVRKD